MDPKPPPSPSPSPPPPPLAPEPVLSKLPSTCPVCGEARETDAQFCQACGHNFVASGDAPAPTSGLRGPLLWLVVVFWSMLAIAGLYWLYTGLYKL